MALAPSQLDASPAAHGASPSRAATLTDVSRQTGLSVATVSRVLNGRPNVSDTARRKVNAAAKTLGYRANAAARALVRQRTDNIGVVFPNIDNDFFREVLVGINHAARQSGRHLMVAFALDAEDEPDLIAEYLSGGRVDGLIVLNIRQSSDALGDLTQESIPVVLVAGPAERRKDRHMVRMANEQGADDAVTHLLEHGRRRLAILDGAPNNSDAVERAAGARRALDRAGIDRGDVRFWEGNFFEDTGYDAVHRAVATGEMPDAIFAANDSMALGAMQALRELGRRVPDDVAVMGFDDLPAADHYGLSTVRAPLREMGAESARVAIELIEAGVPTGPLACHDRVMPTSLICRSSCGCPACTRPPASAAAY